MAFCGVPKKWRAKARFTIATFGLSHVVGISEVATGQQWSLHGREIAGRYGGLLHVHVLVFALVIPGNDDVAGVIGIGEVGIVSTGDCPCSGQ